MSQTVNILSDDGKSSIYAERIYKKRIKVYSFSYETERWGDARVIAESDFKDAYPRLYRKLLLIESHGGVR